MTSTPQAEFGSVPATAPLGRRLAALGVDWAACLAISATVAPTASGFWITRGNPWVTLAVFAVENWLLVGLLGHTLGHRLLGLTVRRGDGSAAPVGLLAGAVRSVLLCLVIPAVVWHADGRGLHDLMARTVIIRSR